MHLSILIQQKSPNGNGGTECVKMPFYANTITPPLSEDLLSRPPFENHLLLQIF